MTHPGNSEYVLVPREPTQAMCEAGYDAAPQTKDGCEPVWPTTCREIYRAMLAAAPAQPSSWHRIDDPANPAPNRIRGLASDTAGRLGISPDDDDKIGVLISALTESESVGRERACNVMLHGIDNAKSSELPVATSIIGALEFLVGIIRRGGDLHHAQRACERGACSK